MRANFSSGRVITLLAAATAVGGLAAGVSATPDLDQTPQGQVAPAPAAAPARGRGAPRVPAIPDAPTLDYTLVPGALALPEGMTYGVVAAIGVNSKQHVFVYQRMPVPIVEFDEQGRFVRGLREGTDTRAHGLRIDSDDNIWIVDSGAHTVTKLSPQGDVLMTLGTKGVTGSGADAASRALFNIPCDIAIAPNGDLFISQGEGGGPDPRVLHFDRNGKFLGTWSLAYAEGPRSNPHSIEVDRNGLIYVADREVMRIRVFRPDGTPVRDIQMQNLVCGLFIDRNQQLWVSTGADGMVLKVDADGKVLGKLGTGGRGPGQIGEGHLLTVTPGGDIYVADSVNRTVHKFVKR